MSISKFDFLYSMFDVRSIFDVRCSSMFVVHYSDTFNKIQGQTTVVWKMQRYELIREYESRPILPPPLIVFGHLYRLVYMLCCKRCCAKDETKFGFRESSLFF